MCVTSFLDGERRGGTRARRGIIARGWDTLRLVSRSFVDLLSIVSCSLVLIGLLRVSAFILNKIPSGVVYFDNILCDKCENNSFRDENGVFSFSH